jgi:hypothetical protein
MITKEQLIAKYRSVADEKMQPLVNQVVELIATAFEAGLELGLSLGEEFINEYTKDKKLEDKSL